MRRHVRSWRCRHCIPRRIRWTYRRAADRSELPPDELAAVDDWLSGQSEPLSRPETIRRLIKIALKEGRQKPLVRYDGPSSSLRIAAITSAA